MVGPKLFQRAKDMGLALVFAVLRLRFVGLFLSFSIRKAECSAAQGCTPFHSFLRKIVDPNPPSPMERLPRDIHVRQCPTHSSCILKEGVCITP